MRKVMAEEPERKGNDTDVNYEDCLLIGSASLCGTTETGNHIVVNKRVTCRACIAVRDHVFGR